MQKSDWSQADGTARAVLLERGGAAPMSAFVAAGLTPYQVAAMRNRGVLERPRKGWYADPALTWQGKCAVRVGGVLACISALRSFGVPVPHGSWDRLHILVPPNTPRLRHSRDSTWQLSSGDEEAVRIHWSATAGAVAGWRTDLVDALLQAASCVPPDWFVVALDAVLHRPRDAEPMLSDAAFGSLVARLPAALLPLLASVDARSESLLETLLRLELRRRGIGPFEIQVWPHPAHRVDFLLRGKLVVEVDGEQFHDPAADAIRDARLRELGYHVIHVTYDQVVFDMPGVIALIETALDAV